MASLTDSGLFASGLRYRLPRQGRRRRPALPLGADITKKMSRDYGVLIEDRGIALRGLFVIDPEGVLRYKVVHDLNIGRSAEETLRVIQALQTGGLCQAEWRPGQETIKT